ncbi:MAG: hypothetical protein ACYDAR_04485 [Thermomicrobiales bacterium]
MRFITSSTATTTEPRRGLPGALRRLAEECGFPLGEEQIRGVIVAGPPIALHVIGACSTTDQAVLDHVEQLGIARVVAPSLTPPRHPMRDRSWHAPIADAWRDGQLEALLVIIPPGALPVWAPPLLTALDETSLAGDGQLLIVGSDADLERALPPGTRFIPRGDNAVERMMHALNRIRAARLLGRVPGDATIVSRPEAVAIATRAVAARQGESCVFLDVADGTTIVVAQDGAAAVYHDPAIDYAHGTVRLLNRVGPEAIARWLPFSLDATALRTWAVRRASWPMAILTSTDDCAIAAAFARAALRTLLDTVGAIPNGARWMLGPSVTRLGSPMASLGLIADLMPAVRLATVVSETEDLSPALGVCESFFLGDTLHVLQDDAFLPIGSVIRASLDGERPAAALSATVTRGRGTMTVNVAPNATTTIAGDGAATVTLTRSGRDDAPIEAQGGPGGILVDTRRRPLRALPQEDARPNVSARLRSLSAVNDVSPG